RRTGTKCNRLFLNSLEEVDRTLVIIDEDARVVEAARRARALSAEEGRGIVAYARCVYEIDRPGPGPGYVEHAPMIGGVADGLFAILIPRANLDAADEGILVELISEVGPQRILLAFAVLDVIHRCAPELEARIGEIFGLCRVRQGRARSRPSVAQEL